MVDGAQGAGCMPIDVQRMHIDLLAFPGHKGLLGPLGTGGLYTAPYIALQPLLAGGTGTDSKVVCSHANFRKGSRQARSMRRALSDWAIAQSLSLKSAWMSSHSMKRS